MRIREEVSAEALRLIGMLDTMSGDPDLEPYLAGGPNSDTGLCDDREASGCFDDDDDTNAHQESAHRLDSDWEP